MGGSTVEIHSKNIPFDSLQNKDIWLLFVFGIASFFVHYLSNKKPNTMPKMHINKSIKIDAPIEKVYKTLNDFNHWTAWSPWLITEPEVKVKVSDDSKYYEWEGKRTGSGHMKIVDEQTPHHIEYDLTFLKPWKSHSKVGFDCVKDGDGTKVYWTMDSSLPFFMFWMKKSMEAFVGADYERGLALLKDYVEEGEVSSKLEFKGYGQYPGCQYIGISRKTNMDKIDTDMKADFEKVGEYAHSNMDNLAGTPFSIYHKWDFAKGDVSYTSGVPVKEMPADLPEGFISGSIPATKIYTVRHIGPYKHLGNAWTTLYMMQRGKEIKPVKGIHPFESYVNSPTEVDENDLITDINFAVK